MIVTDPAGGASLGPRFGYSSKFGRGPVGSPNVDKIHLDNVAKLAFLFSLPFASGYFATTRIGAAAASALYNRVLPQMFRPGTWVAYNVWQERGELTSLLRGEEQEFHFPEWQVRPIRIGTLPTGGAIVFPLPFPGFDLRPVSQDDMTKVENEISQIPLPEVIQSPGNSSQVLPAGSVSPGGTPLGWIPVITTERKRRKLSR